MLDEEVEDAECMVWGQKEQRQRHGSAGTTRRGAKRPKGLDEAAAARNQEQVGTHVHGQWREGGLWGVYQLRR